MMHNKHSIWVLLIKLFHTKNLKKKQCNGAEEMLEHSPLALRCLKASLNADCDGQMGLLDMAGNATLLYYMSLKKQKKGSKHLLKNESLTLKSSHDFHKSQ